MTQLPQDPGCGASGPSTRGWGDRLGSAVPRDTGHRASEDCGVIRGPRQGGGRRQRLGVLIGRCQLWPQWGQRCPDVGVESRGQGGRPSVLPIAPCQAFPPEKFLPPPSECPHGRGWLAKTPPAGPAWASSPSLALPAHPGSDCPQATHPAWLDGTSFPGDPDLAPIGWLLIIPQHRSWPGVWDSEHPPCP